MSSLIPVRKIPESSCVSVICAVNHTNQELLKGSSVIYVLGIIVYKQYQIAVRDGDIAHHIRIEFKSGARTLCYHTPAILHVIDLSDRDHALGYTKDFGHELRVDHFMEALTGDAYLHEKGQVSVHVNH